MIRSKKLIYSKNPLSSKIKQTIRDRAILFLPIKIKTRRNTPHSVFFTRKKKKKRSKLWQNVASCRINENAAQELFLKRRTTNRDKWRQTVTNDEVCAPAPTIDRLPVTNVCTSFCGRNLVPVNSLINRWTGRASLAACTLPITGTLSRINH